MYWIENADSALLLPTLPAASVDALVTDPPAGIGFMNKEWDDFRRARNPADAGRDSVHGRLSRSGPEYGRRDRDHFIAWLAGILRECRRIMKPGAYGWVWTIPRTSHWTATACEDAGFAVRDVLTHVFGTGFPKSRSLLKPAAEHWILVKAPGELRELRIEENRIGTSKQSTAGYDASISRWPANFALSHSDDCADTCVEDCPVRLLDEQAGPLKVGLFSTKPATTLPASGANEKIALILKNAPKTSSTSQTPAALPASSTSPKPPPKSAAPGCLTATATRQSSRLRLCDT